MSSPRKYDALTASACGPTRYRAPASESSADNQPRYSRTERARSADLTMGVCSSLTAGIRSRLGSNSFLIQHTDAIFSIVNSCERPRTVHVSFGYIDSREERTAAFVHPTR